MSSILDDRQKIADIDKEGMCKIIERFPEQCENSINISKNFTFPKEVKISKKLSIKYRKPRNIVIVGMGGSAIGGNLLKDWLKNTLSIPIEVYRSYHIPAYVNEKTLVLALSYSGNTEETLSAYLEAVEKGCMTLAITSGGLLQKFSNELGVPFIRLPADYPPRSAIAYLFFPLVISLERLRLINYGNELNETVEVLKKVRDLIKSEIPLVLNPSKKIALLLKGSIPFICGSGIFESVALRMKTQFNENSKTPAKFELFPELNHNETVGWTSLKGLTSKFSIILIRDNREETEIKTRIDLTKKLVFDKGTKNVIEIQTKGESKLARMFSAMYIGDFASIYLALLYGIDPTPVFIIDELKKQLGKKVNKVVELHKKLQALKVE